MFCSNCGNELRQGLKYCNRCGAITTAELEKSAAVSATNNIANSLSIAIGWIGVAGVVALAILIGNILRRDDITPPHAIMVMIFAALIFGIIFIIVRQISNFSGKNVLQSVTEASTAGRESLPRTANTPQLEPFREPIGSVTEHTTRAFDEVLLKKTEN